MKNIILQFFLFSVVILQAQNARLTLLNGQKLEANITEALPYEITALVKGKLKVFKADSLAGFRFEGNEYLSLKLQRMEHFEFAYKLKSLDEFELYGWREVFYSGNENSNDYEQASLYKFIKRSNDERTQAYEYSKEGVEQMPILNCPSIMKELLKKYNNSEDLIEILNTYERDCGIEMRSK